VAAVSIDRTLSGVVSWTVTDEPMERGSHALAAEGRYWLVDPVADEKALAAAEKLGEPAAVLQLLDRHPRDCEELAARYSVPHLRLPEQVEDSPFEMHRVAWIGPWRELALWWPAREILLVPETVGTASYFAVGRRAGIHPFLRIKPPSMLREFTPKHLLCGHGPPLHKDATAGLKEAIDKSRVDIPKAAFQGIKAFVPGRN
jgi:hypothetical protein